MQIHFDFDEFDWFELPTNVTVNEGYFVCQVRGESMNRKIPDGSWCLFRKDPGGSREGKIVLVEHYDIQDTDFGAGYTIKSYHSEKTINAAGWSHKSILLKPLSFDSDYEDIVLNKNDMGELKVIGEFIKILDK